MRATIVLCIVSLTLATPAFAASSQAQTPPQPTRYTIVVTGGELLAGAYADGHTHYLTRTLRPLGLQCVGSLSVDDNRADLQAALGFAAGRAPLVIVTGGLGPTDNDITREALSEFTGIELKEQQDVLEDMARRFGASPDQLRDNLRRQVQAPVRGTYLKNYNGTALGLVFDKKDQVIIALPGPPHELQMMVRHEMIPYLAERFGTRRPGCSITLRFVGLGQSQIDQTLEDHVPLAPDIVTSSQFTGGRVDFTFSLPNDTPKDRQRLQRLKQDIAKHLGQSIYAEGDTTLEEHVASLLAKRDATLALAEIGSGAVLTHALAGTPAAPRILAGAYVAPTAAALSRLLLMPNANPTAAQWAEAAAKAAGSQWALAVGPARSDDEQRRYVDVALRRPDGQCENRRIRLRGTDEAARLRLNTQLLDQLRRRLK